MHTEEGTAGESGFSGGVPNDQPFSSVLGKKIDSALSVKARES